MSDEMLTPVELHGVTSPDEYRQRQATFIHKYGRRTRGVVITPFVSADHPQVFIAAGRWLIYCTTPGCRNAPVVHPDWRLALCFDCGAIYEQLEIPENRAEIETALKVRGDLNLMNWRTKGRESETLDDITRINAAEFGLPDAARGGGAAGRRR